MDSEDKIFELLISGRVDESNVEWKGKWHHMNECPFTGNGLQSLYDTNEIKMTNFPSDDVLGIDKRKNIDLESLERRDKASRLVEAVIMQLKEIENLIAKGKGNWPNNDYVKDDTWASWQTERRCLQKILRRAGFDVLE